jgi:hypothetical protein
MASTIQLKRSALSGKVPDTGSLNLGELAVNTFDGKIFFKKSGSVESIQSVVTTNSITTGSIELVGALTASIAATNGVVSGSSQVISILTSLNSVSSSLISKTGSYATTGSNSFIANQQITGSLGVSGDVTVLGAINARQFNIGIISSSILYQSGSNKFGDTTDDTHQFTGSVGITGSLLINGVAVGGSSNSGSFTGSFSGSFVGDGSGLRGVVSDDIPRDGWDYQSNSSASISDFNASSDKYQIDFAKEPSTSVGTPVGYKGFLSNVSGSTQIVPTLNTVDFIVGNNVVATIDSNGIQASAPAGTVSGSSQLTSSYDSRYVLSGSITQTTWDNIASKPGGIISGSSQLTSSVLATTGSNSFIGNQNISGTIYLTGSIIPNSDNLYDLGSSTKSFRHLYVSSGSIYLNGAKVLSSTAQELQFTTDAGQSIKILEAGTDTITLQSADGNITLASSGGGDVVLDPTTGVIGLKGTTTLYSGNKIVSSDGNAIQFGNDLGITGSLITTGNVNGINLSTFSSSIATTFNTIQSNTSSLTNRLNNIETFSSSVLGHIVDINTKTGSFETKFTTLQTLTASVQAQVARIQESTASLNTFSSSQESKNVTIGYYTASMNSFTASNGNTSLNAATSSYAKANVSNIFSADQTITGSLFISQNLVVGGSSSIQNISSSTLNIGTNLITVNTLNPSARFGGLSAIDSGSTNLSGSILFDSITNQWIFQHQAVSGAASTSSVFITGPETSNALGSETLLSTNRIPKIRNGAHLNDSNISDDGTTISLASNTNVTGSIIAISFTGSIGATNGVVSGSSQVIGILSSLNSFSASNGNTSLNTYTASIDTKFTTLQSLTASNSASIGQINAVTASLNAATSSYETKGRGIVSGSSQVDVMSTTNIARLATTGSNTFNANQIVTGSLTTTSNVSVGGVITLASSIHTSAQINFKNAGSETELFKLPLSNNTITKYGATDKLYYKTDKAVSNQNILAMNTEGEVLMGTTTTNSAGKLQVAGNIVPEANGTRDLGSASYRWSTIYTSDLSLNNGIGDWTIVEGEDDLFLYNNKKGKVYKFALTEVDPNVATPKKS